MPTRSQVQSWDTTALDDATQRWRGAAAAAETAFEQHRQNIASPGGTDWEGDAKDAALDRVAADLGVVRRQGDVQRHAADVAARGGEDISAARGAVLDAKLNFDDNALYRHADVVEMRDLAEEDPAEIEASKYDLSFIKLDGNVGCMVNGAGLAMATMDTIKFFGGEPANFLDVGGGATTEKVKAAFGIITSDPSVKAIFVNIFGGIMKCDTIAEGVIAAVQETGLAVPLVVRLEGTNVDLGKKLLAESGLNIIPADSMADGAKASVAAAAGN